jgi:hypothetical protein
MRVDLKVTGPGHGQVEPAIPRDLFQHVVEEGKARRNLDATAALE